MGVIFYTKKGEPMITVFTTSQCAYCAMVKKFLTAKGKEYRVINLDENPTERQSLFEKTGALTVPITQVDNEYVVGWNPSKLAALI